MTFIHSVQLSYPEHIYNQDDIVGLVKELWGNSFFNFKTIEQFFRNTKVGERALAFPKNLVGEKLSFKQKNDLWIEESVRLSSLTIEKLCQEAGLEKTAIDILATNTITGVAVPSLDSLLINKLQLNPQIKKIPLFGYGCGGGLSGLNVLLDWLKAYPERCGIFLSSELCSLTFQDEDMSIPNIISTGLFGDGVGAVLCVGEEHPLAKKAKLKRKSSFQHFFYNSLETMGWSISEKGLSIILSKNVHEYARDSCDLVKDFLHSHQLNLRDIHHWVVHPGGPKILSTMENALELEEKALEKSWQCLYEKGNLSSVSVLYILNETLSLIKKKGEHLVLSAMGPGFYSESMLVESV